MKEVHIHNVLAHSERVVGKMACTVRASGVDRHACEPLDTRTRRRKLAEVHAARRSGNEGVNKDEAASDPVQTHTHAAFGVRRNDPRERPDLRCVLWNRRAHIRALRWAVVFLVDRFDDAAPRTFDSGSDSCWAHVRMVRHVLHSCIDSISKALGDREVYLSGAEARVFLAVVQSQVWERDVQ
jgi:hypothetical protein